MCLLTPLAVTLVFSGSSAPLDPYQLLCPADPGSGGACCPGSHMPASCSGVSTTFVLAAWCIQAPSQVLCVCVLIYASNNTNYLIVLEVRCPSGRTASAGMERKNVSLAFPVFRGCPTSLAHGPFLGRPSQNTASSNLSLSHSLSLICIYHHISFSDCSCPLHPCDDIGPPA